ncbi:Fic family protein [Oceaniovalibus sp. ACAM 378]|uniref:Fic family protein n=1 Tax=Oceaniovalibus sp. ACAM 378 TaxID=2599923 RepID=UPI0011DC4AEB|nr:Fic family protein [Oceaniovalibus sp. ACAM 378]TYB86790.1 cell filamentation protein Fic [Oceaniovalibus sp. ACAM 378]
MNFYGRKLPGPGRIAGYGWLVSELGLRVPMPRRLAFVSDRHTRQSEPEWEIFRAPQWPGEIVFHHLVFAIKNEGIDLRILHEVTRVADRSEISQALAGTTSVFARRVWFFWEWLTGEKLDVPDLGKVKYEPALDPNAYFVIDPGDRSARHKVINNLPGTPAFCPLVQRSLKLHKLIERGLPTQAREVTEKAPQHIVSRAAAFLLLNDSKASFAIEQEKPGPQRAARWARAIGEAGSHQLSLNELERLQQVVLQDARFVKMGIRTEGGFVGGHSRDGKTPEPVHISARHEDLPDLLEGLALYEARALGGGVDPMVVAAALSFGFVYIHPFEDGNGRIHRYLLHHVLAHGGFSPAGLVFPISVVVYRRIEEYSDVLKSVSGPMMEFIEWKPTAQGNVEVLSETAVLYRFFDSTEHAEFVADCVREAVEHDLPGEIDYITRYDRFKSSIDEMLEMPARIVDLLRGFLEQGNGKLSKRALRKEFSALTEGEVTMIEEAYAEAWDLD